ncbi:MAG: AAA family ATPase [Helicobacteraceae bacterium]|nr:AAA family ATPase [Helicobacteraceae bacterium]
MILSSLKLENFKSYKTKTIEFGQGLIGIIGKNGSGKSTIFEAILFALYGELKGRGWKETIRNAEATTKDVVSIELVFEFDAKEYRVLREFRGKALSANAHIYKNGELEASGAREVTSCIVALTKMSKDAFMHTLFASQKELTSLSSLKNEDRKKMIRKLLGLEKIDFIENLLVEKSRELKREVNASVEYLMSSEEIGTKQELKAKNIVQKGLYDQEIVSKSKELAASVLKELEIKKELVKLQATKESKQKLLSELQLLKNSINSNATQLTKLTSELKELEIKQSELKKLEPIKQKYQTLLESLKEQEQLKEYHLKKEGLTKEQVQLRDQYIKSKTDIATLEKECENYDKFVVDAKELEKNIAILQESISNRQTIEKEFHAQVAGEQKLVDETNKKIANIQNLGAGSNCPTCTRPLLEEYDNVLNSLNEIVQNRHKIKIDNFTAQLTEVEKQKNEFVALKQTEEKKFLEVSKSINIIQSKQKDLTSLREHFKTVEQKGLQNKEELKKLEAYSYDEAKHRQMKLTQNELKAKYENILQLETMLKRFSTIELELKTTTATIAEQNTQYNTKESAWKLISYDETLHVAKVKLHEESLKLKDEQTKAEGELKVKVASLDGELKTIQNALEHNDKQLKKVQLKKDDLLDYDKIKVSLGEFKTKINSKVAPRISSIASEMYATITKGKYQHIEVSNDFDFYIYDEGIKYPIERFSGGEVDLANLVLRIAISKTLAELNGTNSVGFLAFDEVFGSQDEARRMEILEAFHTIKEQYRQIFLISHEMDIKEMFEMVVEL